MSFRRRDLLLSSAAAMLLRPTFARAAAPTGGKKLITVWCNGGWDVSYCMDPKADSAMVDGPNSGEDRYNDPAGEELVTYADGMKVWVNDNLRPSVRQFFESYAGNVAIVNGVSVASIGHQPCRWRMISGGTDGSRPDVGVIAGNELGATLPLGSVDFSGFSMSGPFAASAGRIGATGQVQALLDPHSSLPAGDPTLTYPLFVPQAADEEAQRAVIEARVQRLLGVRGGGGENERRIAQYFEARERMERFRQTASPVLAGITNGDTPSFQQSIGLGAELLAEGICQSVFVDTNLIWDTHLSNFNQHANFDVLFAGLGVLHARLEELGILQDTLVYVASEMTRTPQLNADFGKDHWPHTSVMFFGGGVRGGRVYGGTDEQLISNRIDYESGDPTDTGTALTYDSLCAGILASVGVDPGEWFPGSGVYRGPL